MQDDKKNRNFEKKPSSFAQIEEKVVNISAGEGLMYQDRTTRVVVEDETVKEGRKLGKIELFLVQFHLMEK